MKSYIVLILKCFDKGYYSGLFNANTLLGLQQSRLTWVIEAVIKGQVRVIFCYFSNMLLGLQQSRLTWVIEAVIKDQVRVIFCYFSNTLLGLQQSRLTWVIEAVIKDQVRVIFCYFSKRSISFECCIVCHFITNIFQVPLNIFQARLRTNNRLTSFRTVWK